MGNGVLDIFRKLGDAAVGIFVGDENRVVSETAGAAAAEGYAALQGTLEEMAFAAGEEGYHAAETGRAGLSGVLCELCEQGVDVGAEIVVCRKGEAVPAGDVLGVAGGMYAGGAAKGVYFQAGVVGKAVEAGKAFDEPGLDYGVLPEGGCGLFGLGGDAEVCGGDHFHKRLKYYPGLAELPAVAGCKQQFHTGHKDTRNYYLCRMIDAKLISAEVEKLFSSIEFTGEPAGLYDPLRYMIGIGGKRLRPTLCLTAFSLFKDGFVPEVLECAAALEVFHTFTLIHDDIMDRSPLRRGFPTVWKKWNEDTAILSGDVMLIDAYKRIVKAPAHCRAAVVDLFSQTAAEVCEGQQFDMEFESRHDVTMHGYERMIGLKTAVLLACSAKVGALAAGAGPKECDALYQYGYQLGMAFQIADDYLDAYGDQKVFGKPIGGDIINGKKSWLTIRALEKTSDKAAFMDAFLADAPSPEAREAKISSVKLFYDTLGVASDARAEIRRYSDLAMEAVKDIHCDISVLRAFCEKLIGRAR